MRVSVVTSFGELSLINKYITSLERQSNFIDNLLLHSLSFFISLSGLVWCPQQLHSILVGYAHLLWNTTTLKFLYLIPHR